MFRNLYMALGLAASMIFGGVLLVRWLESFAIGIAKGMSDRYGFGTIFIMAMVFCLGAILGGGLWKLVWWRKNRGKQ